MFVFGQFGFAIDWDRSTGLTVWSSHTSTVQAPVATHALSRVPKNEREATMLARRWWRQEGRAMLTGATGEGDGKD